MTQRDHDHTDTRQTSCSLGPILGPARYVTINGAATATGLSEGAVRKRLQRGIWLQDKHYRKAPDGRIYIDLHAVEKWIESDS